METTVYWAGIYAFGQRCKKTVEKDGVNIGK
jgi:hypothetical protein